MAAPMEPDHVKDINARPNQPKDINFDSVIVDIDFHPARDVIAAGSIEGDVTVHSYSLEQENHQLLSFNHHKKSCRALEFSPEGSRLCTVSKDKSLQCIDVETGSLHRAVKQAHDAALYTVLVIDENMIATGDEDGRLKLWDMRRDSAVMDIKENDDYISAMAINSKKRLLLATSGEGTLTAFDTRKHKMKMQSELFDSEFLSLAIVRGEEKVVCGDGEGVLNMFNWGEWGNISERFPGHPSSVDCMIPISRDLVCTGSMDGLIRAVHFHPNRFLGVVGQHDEFPVENLSKSRCGRFVASCSHDQKIKFWNIEDIEKQKLDASEKPQRVLKTKAVGKSVAKDDFFSDLAETEEVNKATGNKDSDDDDDDDDEDDDDEDDDDDLDTDDDEAENSKTKDRNQGSSSGANASDVEEDEDNNSDDEGVQ